jgi:predicted MFS family arabinose efflux permease
MVVGSVGLVLAIATVLVIGGWIPVLLGLFSIGLASGLLDALGSRYVALSGSVGHAGLVAGTYGIGATLGPATATVINGWRAPFVIAMIVAVAATCCVVGVGDGWATPSAPVRPRRSAEPAVGAPRPRTRREAKSFRAGVAVSMLLFFLFVSIEVTGGAWLATYLEDHRGLSGGRAGLAVTAFWAGLTVGRLSLGAVARRARIPALLPLLPVVIVAGCALVALAPSGGVVLVTGLVGVALSPTMPTLIASTASRVGEAAVSRVTGWQLVAANAGAISVPALVGLLVDHIGPGVTPVVLAALAAVGLPPLLWAARRAGAPLRDAAAAA